MNQHLQFLYDNTQQHILYNLHQMYMIDNHSYQNDKYHIVQHWLNNQFDHMMCMHLRYIVCSHHIENHKINMYQYLLDNILRYKHGKLLNLDIMSNYFHMVDMYQKRNNNLLCRIGNLYHWYCKLHMEQNIRYKCHRYHNILVNIRDILKMMNIISNQLNMQYMQTLLNDILWHIHCNQYLYQNITNMMYHMLNMLYLH